ncbi:azurin [Phytopseudomonas daroniae]|uniref:azurin n=1 Tax=Phytopseudomonas daroniae TaxID=2487519 RepID=UPI0010382F09|nr:azurin [Pseudomonas daroniae]TBU72210.1 azurin [Pseudomonas daroniae]
MQRALLLALGLALPGLAWSADDCAIEIHGTDQMTFDKSEIVVPASCERFTVTLKHPGTLPKEVMGHNWVLSATSDVPAIIADGSAAGVEQGYLKPDDPRVIAHTRLLGGGEQDSVIFDTKALKADGDYQFFCSFPAHSVLMKGRLKLGA